MPVYSSIEEAISQATKEKFSSQESSSLSGGSISRSQCIKGNDGRVFFCKENDLSFLSFFEAEAKALQEIKATNTIRTPEVITSGTTDLAHFFCSNLLRKVHPLRRGRKRWENNWRGYIKSNNPSSDGLWIIVLDLLLNLTHEVKTG